MERGKFESYGLIVGVMIFLVIAVYYLGGGFTGYAVYNSGPGADQTTLTLQEPDTENLDDVYVHDWDEGSEDGTNVSGFAVFGEGGRMDNYLTIGIVFIFLVFAFFIIRKILKHKLKAKIKRKKR